MLCGCNAVLFTSSQTICQKTPDTTAEYFAAVWALHAMSKVEALRRLSLTCHFWEETIYLFALTSWL